ncbi:MAG: PAS domain S-box protein [Rubrivivax sp.]|nr:PAS domain S-box protein [Rubrivivax sp.]
MAAPNDSRRTTPEESLPALPALQAQPEAAAELSPLGLMLSSQRRIVWCNRRFAEMFGYPREALIGAHLAQLYPSDVEFQRIGERGLRVMQERAEYQDERLMRRRDGLVQWFRVHGRADDRADPFRLASWVFEPLAAGVDASRLTPREREVLAAMARGQTAKQCARELGLSPRTVEKLRAQLRERFGAHNAAELMSRVGGLPH